MTWGKTTVVFISVVALLLLGSGFSHKDVELEDEDVDYINDNEEKKNEDFFKLFSSPGENANPCKTKACQTLQKTMVEKIDSGVNPCDDMYQFSCGGMLKKPLKDGHSRSTFRDMNKQQTEILKKIIQGLKNTKGNNVNTKMYNWYSACVNIEQRNKLKASPMLDLLKSLGTWPLLNDEWDEENWDIEKVLAAIHQNASVFPLFRTSVGNDARNVSSLYYLQISKPTLSLDVPEFYLKQSPYSDRIIYAYFQLLVKLGELLGAKDILALMYDILDVIKFEIRIAQAMTLDKRHSLVTPYTTLGSLQESYEGVAFNWKRYISFLYQDLPKQPSFEDTEIIYIDRVKYFERVMSLISSERPRVLANYMLAQVVFHYGADLSETFRDSYVQYYLAAYGVKASTPLTTTCVRSTTYHLNAPITALYVKKSLPDKDLKKAKELVHTLTLAYMAHIKNIKWMDSHTRNAALEKVQAMTEQVGYPKIITNGTVLNKAFKKFVADPLSYFENVRTSYRRVRTEILNLRGKAPNKKGWEMRYTMENAEYSPNANKISVVAGLLQPPLFHSDYPSSVNFGSIGAATGHEITHGFDASGARFDKDGNVKVWWTKKTYQKFVEKTKCMLREYSKFMVYGEHLNSRQTLNENIADNGGIRIAYEAYSKWLKSNAPDLTLPALKFTSKQLFFISFSQLWCNKNTKASAINALHTDEHSPSKARVNYVLSNMKEFSEAFKCSKESQMNRKKKCIVW